MLAIFLFVNFQGIIKRDEFVFEICKSHKIPIVMLTSGGYVRRTARIIADSIINLKAKRLIGNEPKSKISTIGN